MRHADRRAGGGLCPVKLGRPWQDAPGLHCATWAVCLRGQTNQRTCQPLGRGALSCRSTAVLDGPCRLREVLFSDGVLGPSGGWGGSIFPGLRPLAEGGAASHLFTENSGSGLPWARPGPAACPLVCPHHTRTRTCWWPGPPTSSTPTGVPLWGCDPVWRGGGPGRGVEVRPRSAWTAGSALGRSAPAQRPQSPPPWGSSRGRRGAISQGRAPPGGRAGR